VFEFFKITTPERVGFAKHREAAERKAAALAATETDAGETATSPRPEVRHQRKSPRRLLLQLRPMLRPKGKIGRNVAPD
jgi:hypothetical protein